MKTILVTAALPYANGDIHLGHLLECSQADFWVAFQKMQGHKCLYICADDTHGTPIMIKAKQENISPQQLIDLSYQEHVKDFANFQINFDNYGSTDLAENKQLCEQFYTAMKKQKHVEVRTIKQAYCLQDNMFLPDRFVKGDCPKCGAFEQYGDACEEEDIIRYSD